MRLLILGASGLLGRALMKSCRARGATAVGASSCDADLRNARAVAELIDRTRPQWTILCAAYTDVDGCERNPALARAVNVEGAANAAQAVRNHGSMLMLVSTDYVFDGAKQAPYETTDATNPVNVYGRSKRDAEVRVRELLPRACILRTAWLFGEDGKCFPKTILRLAATETKLSVVADQVGAPTYTRDLAEGILDLARQNASGLLHFTNTGTCSWHEFASRILADTDWRGELKPSARVAAERPARRPGYSVLSLESLRPYGIVPRRWAHALGDFLKGELALQAVAGGSRS